MRNSLIYCGIGLGVINAFSIQGQEKKQNVLFIAIDDLRPELHCYGAEHMITPNIDRLAAQGTLFQQAYCQQAISAASRNSLLTGLRPDAIGIYDLATNFRKHVPDVVTLPQCFKENGYRTEAVGKIYHVGHGNIDDSVSWSVPKWDVNARLGRLRRVNNGDTVNIQTGLPRVSGEILPYYASNLPEEDMVDARTVEVAIQRMKEIKDNPFFLAVGLVKPHLPFVAPGKYWEMYNEEDIIIPEKKEPEDVSKFGLGSFEELRKYHGMPKTGHVSDAETKKLIHGYRACVSFVDAQIGLLLKALEDNGLADNTIIVLWGDHGWKLGEYGNWCKHSNMEMDTRAPLIISVPGKKKGNVTRSLVEFIDIYPTLCELAGLKKPRHLEGESLVPVLNNPDHQVKEVAISQYPRGKNNKYMGYSMRAGNYRYTRWVLFNSPEKTIVERELYDHSKGEVADKNLASLSAYSQKIEELDDLMTRELGKYEVFTTQ